MADDHRHECAPDAETPVGRVDGYGVQLPQLGVDGVAAGTDARETDDFACHCGDPPPMRQRCGEIPTPALDSLGVERAKGHQVTEARVPGVDVDSRDDRGVVRRLYRG